MKRRSISSLFPLLLAIVVLWGCAPRPGEEATAPDEERHQMRGEVIRVDPAARTATIKHEEIEGWMEAMTMEFPIREGEIQKINPGDVIEATVYVTGYDFVVGDINVVQRGGAPTQ